MQLSKKPDTNDYILHDSIYIEFYKMHNSSIVTEYTSGCLEPGGLSAKRHEGTVWGDRNVLYVDWGDGYTGAKIY